MSRPPRPALRCRGVEACVSVFETRRLIENKKAIIVTTRGGLHKDSPRNSIESYLTTILGFIGITDVEFVYAEALNMGEESAAVAREQARAQLAKLV